MNTGTDLNIHRFNRGLTGILSKAIRSSTGNPGQMIYWTRNWYRQRAKVKTRMQMETEGLKVPPVLIFSCTHSCNLNCKGCYAMARAREEEELPLSRIRTLFRESSGLGVGVIMIAGGEPLTRPEVLWAAGEQKDILFPVFTNGLLLNNSGMAIFKEHPNLIPVISADGGKHRTENRRGAGTYGQIIQRMERLKDLRKTYGMSFTLTRQNYDEITHPVWLRMQRDLGASLFFLVEYVPQSDQDLDLCLTPGQKAGLPRRVESLKKQLNIPVIALPGDEQQFGGCLAGGRGFAHISVSGRLEPCPFAPYSDTSLKESSLKEALRSPFLQWIREHHEELGESRGGCALWEKRYWVQEELEALQGKAGQCAGPSASRSAIPA